MPSAEIRPSALMMVGEKGKAMLYLRVKPEFDNYRKNNRNYDVFVANELYTVKEFEKIAKEYHKDKTELNKMFEYVTISRKRTYFFFGARFAEAQQ